MKNNIKTIVAAFVILISSVSFAQNKKAEVIKLNQVPGKFETTELTLKAGKAYVFEVANEGVDHEVGFVVAPKGRPEQEHHVQAAYIQKTVGNGEKSESSEVVLEKGEYVYFCPMNPTPQYKLTVK